MLASNMIDKAFLDPLRGFWNENHNVPSELRLIEGDKPRFDRDRLAARERSIRRLDSYSGRSMRWCLIRSWDQWDFAEESWI